MSTSYEYSTTSSSKGGADSSGLFEQVDANNDGVIDRTELANFMGDSSSGTSGNYESSSYKKSSKHSSRGGGVADIGLVGLGGRSTYELSSYSSGTGLKGSGLSGRYQSSSYDSTGGYDLSEINQAASYTAETNAAWSRYGAEVRGAGLYYDPNPKIIRRELPGGVQTYTQNVRLRFLQPPPLPPPGPLIVREVRPPQPPALPPLRIKQQESLAVQLPPLILRERPPQPPAVIGSETVVRHLPALPVPPRSVIIERYAGASVAPRDIIIERWLPYSASSTERKTIVERAEALVAYEEPRNVIIQYDVGQVRVVRQFQQLGVTQENPQAYIAQYGAQLLDAQTLLQQARAAGVVEDISVPTGFSSLSSYSSGATYGGVSDATFVGGARIISAADRDLGGASSSYSSRTYESSLGGGTGGVLSVGYKTGFVEGDGLVEGGGSGYSSSTYKSSSYSSSGGAGFDVGSTGFSSTEAKL